MSHRSVTRHRLKCRFCSRMADAGFTLCGVCRSTRVAAVPAKGRVWGKRPSYTPDPAWVKMSRAFRSEFPLCHGCGRPVQIVDHIFPRKLYPERELLRDNLQSLCRRCHGHKTLREKSGVYLDFRNGVEYRCTAGEGIEFVGGKM